jgi:hypothetical protein
MRPLYEDYDEFDLDFADGAIARKIRREEMLEERRKAGRRRAFGPGKKHRREDYEDEFDACESYEEYEDFDEYDEYDDNEFDSFYANKTD